MRRPSLSTLHGRRRSARRWRSRRRAAYEARGSFASGVSSFAYPASPAAAGVASALPSTPRSCSRPGARRSLALGHRGGSSRGCTCDRAPKSAPRWLQARATREAFARMRRPGGATLETGGERHRNARGGRGAGRRCAWASFGTEGRVRTRVRGVKRVGRTSRAADAARMERLVARACSGERSAGRTHVGNLR